MTQTFTAGRFRRPTEPVAPWLIVFGFAPLFALVPIGIGFFVDLALILKWFGPNADPSTKIVFPILLASALLKLALIEWLCWRRYQRDLRNAYGPTAQPEQCTLEISDGGIRVSRRLCAVFSGYQMASWKAFLETGASPHLDWVESLSDSAAELTGHLNFSFSQIRIAAHLSRPWLQTPFLVILEEGQCTLIRLHFSAAQRAEIIKVLNGRVRVFDGFVRENKIGYTLIR